MNLHLYFYDEHKNNIIHRIISCKEAPSRYTPDRAFPYIGMSYLPKENIGKIVGICEKGILFTERNDTGAKEAFKKYFAGKSEIFLTYSDFKKRESEELKNIAEKINEMEVIEK